MSPACRSPRHSNGHGGGEHRPWVVDVLELLNWMDEPLPEDYKGSLVVKISEHLHGGIQSGKTFLAKLFSTNLRVSARKMVWNPNLELHPRGTQFRMCPFALWMNLPICWLVKHAPLDPISLYTWVFFCWPYQAAVLVATLGISPMFIGEPAINSLHW